MKMRETVIVLGGLIIGLALGVVMVGSDDSFRTSLFGAAGSTNIHMSYYVVDIHAVQNWLLSNQSDARLQSAFDEVMNLADSSNFRQTAKKAEPSISLIINTSIANLIEEDQPKEVVACLGLDENPELPQIVVDLYVAVPAALEPVMNSGSGDKMTGWTENLTQAM